MTAHARHAEHFESLERQAHAARFGMWVFLATEVLLFGAAFALFTSYQLQHAQAFHAGVEHNTKILGTINTAVLLVSSTLVACGVHALRAGKNKLACWLVGGTIGLALVFLVIKLTEYREHFHEGIYPGGAGHFFVEHKEEGLAQFWTLYYGMTGLHALHVTIGACVLGTLLVGILRGTLTQETSYKLDIGAIYWHLVDVIWIFLWPLFYLA